LIVRHIDGHRLELIASSWDEADQRPYTLSLSGRWKLLQGGASAQVTEEATQLSLPCRGDQSCTLILEALENHP